MTTISFALMAALSLTLVPAVAADNLGEQVDLAIEAAEAGQWERTMSIVRTAASAADCAMPERNLEQLRLRLELARQRVSTNDSDDAYRLVRRLAGCDPSDTDVASLSRFLAEEWFFERMRSRIPTILLPAVEDARSWGDYLRAARLVWDASAPATHRDPQGIHELASPLPTEFAERLSACPIVADHFASSTLSRPGVRRSCAPTPICSSLFRRFQRKG